VKSPASGKVIEIAAEDEAVVKDEELMFVIEAG
jgi:biotin carboxyl carrier protein